MKTKLLTLLFLFAISGALFSQRTAEDYAKEGADQLQEEKWEAAIRNFTKAIKLNPDYIYKYKSYYGRGFAYFQIKQYSKAKMDFTKAIQEYPNDADLYFWRGFTRYKLGNSEGSEIADYNRAILLKPTYAKAFFNRGWSKWDLGKKDDACHDWEEAFNLGFEEAKTPLEEHCGF